MQLIVQHRLFCVRVQVHNLSIVKFNILDVVSVANTYKTPKLLRLE